MTAGMRTAGGKRSDVDYSGGSDHGIAGAEQAKPSRRDAARGGDQVEVRTRAGQSRNVHLRDGSLLTFAPRTTAVTEPDHGGVERRTVGEAGIIRVIALQGFCVVPLDDDIRLSSIGAGEEASVGVDVRRTQLFDERVVGEGSLTSISKLVFTVPDMVSSTGTCHERLNAVRHGTCHDLRSLTS